MSINRLVLVLLSTVVLSACAGTPPANLAANDKKESAEKTKTNDKCRSTGSRLGRRCS